jgi:CheY-like chemotaxis protein
MSDIEKSTDFGVTARSLAKNPLGIIALFIVMVYGFASMVTTFGGDLTPEERLPLIYFLIVFPILVLAVFTWLVSAHSPKLFAPSDFKNEDNYVKMQMAAAASLSAASLKGQSDSNDSDISKIVKLVQEAGIDQVSRDKGNHILWVDDNPNNNIYEREAFEAVGLRFTLALSTNEALEKLKLENYAADMGRQEGPREGYVLLDKLRADGDTTSLFFYASSNAQEHKQETIKHGGQGCTNNAQELFQMVTKSIIMNQD